MEVSDRICPVPDALIIDCCAMLWVIPCPTNGTVKDFVINILIYVGEQLQKCDTYLIFKRYYDDSIKNATRIASAGKEASRRHQLNFTRPLPPQKGILTVTANKVQLISIIYNFIKENAALLPRNASRFVVTGHDPTPIEIYNDRVMPRDDIRTTHEEADVIIVQQMVQLGSIGVQNIRVICDDTDVFVLLLLFFVLEKLTCSLVMVGTNHGRSVVDIRATAQKHAGFITQVLPAHARSGCDTVAYLWGIWNGTVVKILKTDTN